MPITPQYIEQKDILAQSKFAANTILLASGLGGSDFLSYVISNGVCHVIQGEDNKHLEVRFSEAVVEKNKQFFVNPFEFMALDTQTSIIEKVTISKQYLANNKSEKEYCINHVLKDFESLKMTESIQESVVLICEELLMNMIYDAPKYFEKLPLEIQKKHDKNFSAELFVAADEKNVLFVAIDNYGSIDIQKLISRLHYCYSVEKIELNMNSDAGGAGYGCRMIYDHATSLTVAVEPGVKSVVACVMPYCISQRKVKGMSKSIHIVKPLAEI